jgi:N-acetylglucosamine-6-phosphate deacetylase
LDFLASIRAVDGEGAEVLGSHLEGPFLAADRCGAQRPECLHAPGMAEVERMLVAASGSLRRMTLAPELAGASMVVRRLVAAGVQVSLGHSSCTLEQALAAVSSGASSVTHTFNAMARFHHREPGLIGAALTCDGLASELIADGVHVHPFAALALIRAAREVAVVTDGLDCLGLPEGDYSFMGQPVASDGAVARLGDGTLAGSATPLLQAVRNLVSWGVRLEDAARMASAVGARLAGVAERKGALAEGFDGDVIVLNKELGLVATVCRGRVWAE